MVSDVDQKNNFWREKISLEAIDFLPLKVLYIFCFAPDAVQIRRTFSEATLPTLIFLKEIAYILTCCQALLKAQLFFIIF